MYIKKNEQTKREKSSSNKGYYFCLCFYKFKCAKSKIDNIVGPEEVINIVKIHTMTR